MIEERMGRISVIDSGILTSVQGKARTGKRQWGVGGAGPWDPEAARLANQILGSDVGCPTMEITLRGPTLRFDNAAVIACLGGEMDCDLPDFEMGKSSIVPEGTTVKFGYSRAGIRTYLAIQGGFENELHGALIHQDDVLKISDQDLSSTRSSSQMTLDMKPNLIMSAGPDFHAFNGMADEGLRVWLEPQSNRQAILLKGKTDMSHEVRSDWSRPLFPGFVQLLPDGVLAVIGPDGHTMGGYPRVGVLDDANYSKLGRLRPGTKIQIEVA
jgi:allophanate hydrolase subunit 2